jgi:hypothetical protein
MNPWYCLSDCMNLVNNFVKFLEYTTIQFRCKQMNILAEFLLYIVLQILGCSI